jgi:hypothetical protein
VKQCFQDGKMLRYEAQFIDGRVLGYGHYLDSSNTRCIAKWAGQGYDGPVIQIHSQGSTGKCLQTFLSCLHRRSLTLPFSE